MLDTISSSSYFNGGTIQTISTDTGSNIEIEQKTKKNIMLAYLFEKVHPTE